MAEELWPHPNESLAQFLERCVTGLTAGGMSEPKADTVCNAKWRDAHKGLPPAELHRVAVWLRLQGYSLPRERAADVWHEQPREEDETWPPRVGEGAAPEMSDSDLHARFRDAGEDATEWPGLRSEYEQRCGQVELLAAPLRQQVNEGKVPAARGKTIVILNPVRAYATQYWLSPEGGGKAMLPEFHDKFGKHPVFAKGSDGRLHLLDGHHTTFHHLRNGNGSLRAFVFDIQTADMKLP